MRIVTPVLISLDLMYRLAIQLGTRALRRRPGACSGLDAAYCVSVWDRHQAVVGTPATLVELGPGASLGVGVAFIVAGTERYIALDSVRRTELAVDPQLAAEIANVLGRGLPDDWADKVRYMAPWDRGDVEDGIADAVISQAVMEHVTDVDALYVAMADWLKPGGRVSHQIDFRSHDTSPWWNGHLQYPDRFWQSLKPRKDPPNRIPLSTHLRAMEQAGLRVIRVDVDRRPPALPRKLLAEQFRTLSDDDLTAASAFVVAELPVAHPTIDRRSRVRASDTRRQEKSTTPYPLQLAGESITEDSKPQAQRFRPTTEGRTTSQAPMRTAKCVGP